eukprot:m.229694 g.229694  ORF g.229694 m.229694 type:complete len:93 (-) comp54258_c0_seq14:779-1057(-)
MHEFLELGNCCDGDVAAVCGQRLQPHLAQHAKIAQHLSRNVYCLQLYNTRLLSMHSFSPFLVNSIRLIQLCSTNLLSPLPLFPSRLPALGRG